MANKCDRSPQSRNMFIVHRLGFGLAGTRFKAHVYWREDRAVFLSRRHVERHAAKGRTPSTDRRGQGIWNRRDWGNNGPTLDGKTGVERTEKTAKQQMSVIKKKIIKKYGNVYIYTLTMCSPDEITRSRRSQNDVAAARKFSFAAPSEYEKYEIQMVRSAAAGVPANRVSVANFTSKFRSSLGDSTTDMMKGYFSSYLWFHCHCLIITHVVSTVVIMPIELTQLLGYLKRLQTSWLELWNPYSWSTRYKTEVNFSSIVPRCSSNAKTWKSIRTFCRKDNASSSTLAPSTPSEWNNINVNYLSRKLSRIFVSYGLL